MSFDDMMSIEKYPKKVMLATDGGKHSLKAAKKAAIIAKNSNSKVTIVTVLQPYQQYLMEPGLTSEYEGAAPTPTKIGEVTDSPLEIEGRIDSEEQVQARSRKIMESTKKEFDDLSVKVDTRFLKGNVAKAIIDEAIKERVDLIVVGATGRGGVPEWRLGSTAHRIARNSPCSVMIVR
jgi:nucleotide-binding universal stress UspA family protein